MTFTDIRFLAYGSDCYTYKKLRKKKKLQLRRAYIQWNLYQSIVTETFLLLILF
ncbi:hypothetical protein RchiOBHm_Chr5g0081821 [Rosa chinensis]|uniref:Uncharacterized protein n=1 Tax=Rosa chinensis TaxID=74649 RepID=A0A2P6QN74_ROSCH|nr:hypothetical protein RchiOBHm_Chr5g0081821 [Rosa chinensis]